MSTENRTSRTAAALIAACAIALLALPALAGEGGQGVVNVNTASVEELALLPRVGPAVAGRIVSFREENGPFASKDDLLLVRGIGERTLELLEPYVSTEGKTTLGAKVRVPRPPKQDGEQPKEQKG